MVYFHDSQTCLYIDSTIVIYYHLFPLWLSLSISGLSSYILAIFEHSYNYLVMICLLCTYPILIFLLIIWQIKLRHMLQLVVCKTNKNTIATFCEYVYLKNYVPTDDMILDILWYNYEAYKKVDKKVRPVLEVFPENAWVEWKFPEDPLQNLPILSAYPSDFTPTQKLTIEQVRSLRSNPDRFMWPKEVKLFLHILKLNESAIAFTEDKWSSLQNGYFSSYIISVVLHIP